MLGSKPRAISRVGFIQLCQDAGGMTDQLLVGCNENPLFKPMWIKFSLADSIERDDVRTQAGLVAMEQAGYLPNGKGAVEEAWPTE